MADASERKLEPKDPFDGQPVRGEIWLRSGFARFDNLSLWLCAVLGVILFWGGLTWWGTANLAQFEDQDDFERFKQGVGARMGRTRDCLKVYGADLKRLAMCLSQTDDWEARFSKELELTLLQEGFQSVLHLGIVECTIKRDKSDGTDAEKGATEGFLRPIRRVADLWRQEDGLGWEIRRDAPLDDLGRVEVVKSIQFENPVHDLKMIVWPSAPPGPCFQLFVKVPEGGLNKASERSGSVRLVYATIPVNDLMTEVFGLKERGVHLALYWGVNPEELHPEPFLLHGRPRPLNPPPIQTYAEIVPLFGAELLWDAYSTPYFERRNGAHKVRNLRIGGFATTALLAVIVGLQGHSRSRHITDERELKSLNALLLQQRARLVDLNDELEGERERREQLMGDLHDGILQELAVVHDALPSTAKSSNPSELPFEADQILGLKKRIRAAMSELREFMSASERRLPDGYSLESLLSERAAELDGRNGIRVRSVIDALPYGMLSAESQADLWFASREALSNASRHAKAQTIEVRLRIEGEHVLLTVTDDGVGFDRDKVRHGRGLPGLQRRIEGLGGDLQITSGKSRGTRIEMRIPRPKRSKGALTPS